MTILAIEQLVSILPECLLIIAALMSLVLGAIRGRQSFEMQLYLSMAVITIAAVVEFNFLHVSTTILNHMLIINPFITASKLFLLVVGVVVVWMSFAYYRDHKEYAVSEYPVLILLSLAGTMFMVSANHMLSFFISLELQGIAGYLLAAWHRDETKSSEAGLKYFILGSLASGLLLFGISFIYGFTGTADFSTIFQVIKALPNIHLGIMTGLIFIIIAMSIKLSVAPFHMWAPDVYEGAPTIITTYFMTASKLAAIILLTRLLMGPFVPMVDQWQQIIVFTSIVSMVVGALGAIRQSNIKRLLAYSSIGHVGYMLIGIVTGSIVGIEALAIYLCIYIVTTLGVFAFVMMMRDKHNAREDIASLAGLAKEKPFVALVAAIFMLSLAGIPPMAGFIGKFYIFISAVSSKFYFLAVIGVLSSVVAAYYYLRIIKIMYFDSSTGDSVIDSGRVELRIVAYVVALFSVGLIFYYGPLLQSAEDIVQVLFERN